MMTHGYVPEWSENAVKCPIYQTSTFVFPNAEAGKRFFALAYGKTEALHGEQPGLIYSRLNNPNSANPRGAPRTVGGGRRGRRLRERHVGDLDGVLDLFEAR